MTVTKQSVSVAIIHRNMGAYLTRAVESTLAQITRATLQVLVLDDGSDDALSLAVLDQLQADHAANPRVRFYRGQKTVGIACMRNIAARIARSGILMFVDADDWIGPGYAERLQSGLVAANADVVTGSCYVTVFLDGKKVETAMTREAALTYGSMSAYRMDMVHAMGGWTAGFDRFGGDEGFEFATRLARASYRWQEIELPAEDAYHYLKRHVAGSLVSEERALSIDWARATFEQGLSHAHGVRHPALVLTPPSAPAGFPNFRELALARAAPTRTSS